MSLPSFLRSGVRIALLLGLSLACVLSLGAAERKGRAYFEENFPFQGACINAAWPSNNVAMKGLALRAGPGAHLLFDTDLLRMAAGWTGGFLTTRGVAFDGAHGAHPAIAGEQHFGTPQIPGWADAQGRFADPRQEPFGPLPKAWARWDGLHVHGSNVVLSYTVHGTKVREQPGALAAGGGTAFTRTFRVDKARADLAALLCEVPGATVEQSGQVITLTAGTNVTRVGLSDPRQGRLSVAEGSRVLLHIPKGTPAGSFRVVLWRGQAAAAAPLEPLLAGPATLAPYAQGGPARWPEPVVTQAVLDTSRTPDGAYVTDSLTAPTDNPWNRRVRFGGFDFFADGRRAAFCTHDGDLWIVSGIDDPSGRLEWRRYASGQYETLGLVIVDDVIYTSGRDQLTRYHDLNGDGEADYYENFNNEVMSTEGFHEFLFDLQTDRKGNFYFAKASPVNAGGSGFGNQKAARGNGTVCSHSGCLFKVSKDGSKFEVVATGLRAPTGIGVHPNGQLTTSDNEGTWVPTTPINWIVKPGQFCGVIHGLTPKETAAQWVPPLCWLSKQDYDNSGGGQIWVTSRKWGPYEGALLHQSYGRSSLFLVLDQKLPGDRRQGGVTRFPLKFTSSVMRARFHPRDGQLYIAGLSEWQSNAGKITGFDRVRYTGKPVHAVRTFRVVPGGVELTFTQPLDPASAADTQNLSGKRWNYKRSESYGSPEFSVADPAKRARDPLSITGTRLSRDGRTLFVAIDDLKPVMQQTLKFNLKSADGTPISQEIQHTIHEIP
ncbi:MAG: hypothetical protein RJA22_723 [Verrucomicrobiota bacterium]